MTTDPSHFPNRKSGPQKRSLAGRLLDSNAMYPRHQFEQPADRRRDTTYYNPQTKEKVKDDEKVYRIRGTISVYIF